MTTGTKSEDPEAHIRNCEFRFECPKKWEALTETHNVKIRHCGTCDRNVHYCKTPSELMAAIRKNQCVAVEIHSPKRAKPSVLLGDAAPPPYSTN